MKYTLYLYRVLADAELQTVATGTCPCHGNNTLALNIPEAGPGLQHLDIRGEPDPIAGEALATAIREYWERQDNE